MATHNVTESDNFPANVQMPADGDPADASDFESTTIKPLADRTRWIVNRLTALGGVLSLANDLVWDIALGKTLQLGNGVGRLLLAAGSVEFQENATGRLFGPTGSGRIPKKQLVITPGAGTTTVDTSAYDTVHATPTANCFIKMQAGGGEGAHCRVVNHSSSFTVTVLDPGGGTLKSGLINAVGEIWSIDLERASADSYRVSSYSIGY